MTGHTVHPPLDQVHLRVTTDQSASVISLIEVNLTHGVPVDLAQLFQDMLRIIVFAKPLKQVRPPLIGSDGSTAEGLDVFFDIGLEHL